MQGSPLRLFAVARSLAPPATSTRECAGPHRSAPRRIELLEESENFRPGTSRLSCQIRTDELPQTAVVTLAPEEI